MGVHLVSPFTAATPLPCWISLPGWLLKHLKMLAYLEERVPFLLPNDGRFLPAHGVSLQCENMLVG